MTLAKSMTVPGEEDIEKSRVVEDLASLEVSDISTPDKELPTAGDVFLPAISRARRIGALLIFMIAVFVDVMCSSAFFVFTTPISSDLGIIFGQQTWIITSYSVSFASFLLFWGRVCDIFATKPVFVYGFGCVGILNLVLSFITNRYAFFLFRAMTGVAGACVVPAAYRLIAHTFPPEERGMAYTIFGTTGSIAAVSGSIIGGVFELIPTTGQMAAWRWFFRMVAMIALPCAAGASFVIPQGAGHTLHVGTTKEKIKAMDLPGISCMFAAQVLFIMGLTFGASYGWTKPSFLVPFIIALILYPTFFFWESRLPETEALIPSSTWRIPNVTVLVTFALLTIGWFGVQVMPLIQIYHVVNGESMILAAARCVPLAASCTLVSIVLIKCKSLIRNPRWPIIISLLLGIIAFCVCTQAPSVTGTDYWKWIFLGMIYGGAGMQTVYLSTIVGIMLAAPPGREGVMGAILQTASQTSNVLSLSIQAGLMTTHQGGITNFANVRTSWYFELGWCIVWLVGFVVFYKPGRNGKSMG